MGQKYRNLRDAVRAWVRAEWEFRLGDDAYHGKTTDWLIDAEESLREVLTQQRSLGAAGEALGKVMPKPRKSLTVAHKDTTEPAKKTPRARLKSGLFN